MSRCPCFQQRGSVLLISLVMLLLLTLLATSSLRSTRLQERMAGNFRDQSLALQGAEAALRQGEAAVKAQSVEYWQNSNYEEIWQDGGKLTGVNTPRYRLAPVPGVTIVKPGVSLEAGVPVIVAVVRVEAVGFGAVVNADNTPASSYQLKSMYIKR